MSERFAYQVCQVQFSRVTFVNGDWQGIVGPTGVDQNQAMQSCPYVWDYLQQAGQDGWDLVAACSQQQEAASWQVLYLKRKELP